MMLKRFCAAMTGRRIWLRLKRIYQIDKGLYVLLMPESDQELNDQALRHIDDLIAHRRARGVLILTCDEWVMKNAKEYCSEIVEVLQISCRKVEQLLSAYEFYNFSERFLVVSLIRPYGRNLFQAVGVNGVTKEDLICLGIFLIRNWSA